MNVLVIAPHPDDEAIGCGGMLGLHTVRGDRIAVVFLTSGELGLEHLPREQAWQVREDEAAAAAEILGIASLTFMRRPDWFVGEDVSATADALRPVLEREAPQRIYLPHTGEWHPDHQAALPVVRTALQAGTIPLATLMGYELWTPLPEPNHLEDITTTMTCKLRAVRCYRSQLANLRYDRAIRGLNQYRGIMSNTASRYAEAFQHLEP